jgi:tetratricopeptide (TPR) repeat protein
MALVTSNIGGLYEAQGDLEKARVYLERVLEWCNDADIPQVVATVLNNLASVSEQQGKMDLALTQYEQALELFGHSAHPADRALVLHNLGALHSKMRNYARAISFCKQALAVYEHLGRKFTQSMIDELELLVVLGEQQEGKIYEERLSAMRYRFNSTAGVTHTDPTVGMRPGTK